MSRLTAIVFDDEHKADEVRMQLLRLGREHLVAPEDAVVAIRRRDGKIKLRQIRSVATAGDARQGAGEAEAVPWTRTPHIPVT